MASDKGLKRIFNAMRYPIAGLRDAVSSQVAFQTELILCVFLFPAGILLGENGIERAILVGSIFVVLIVELLNSGIEAAGDRISLERHELSDNLRI